MIPDSERRLLQMAEEADRLMHVSVKRHAELAEQMMVHARELGPAPRALALRVYGNSLRLQGRLPEARQALEESLRLWQEAGQEVEWARTQTAMLPVLAQLGLKEEAVKASEVGLAVLLRHGQTLPAARLLSNTGSLYWYLGRNPEALEHFSRGAELAKQGGDLALLGRLSLNRAIVLQELGHHEESISAAAEALRAGMRTGQRVFTARVLQAGATALFQLGRFDRALRRFARARAMFEAESVPRDLAICDLYIAACYVELNRYAQALTRVRSVLQVLDPDKTGFQYAWARFYEGLILARTGRAVEALHSLTMAGDYFLRNGYPSMAGRTRLEEAQIYLRRGSVEQAIGSAREAEGLFASARMRTEQARAALVRARALFRADQLQAAGEAARFAYRIFRRARMPGPAFHCLHLLGRIAAERGALDTAERLLFRAVMTAERMRSAVHVSFRGSFLEDKSSAYAAMIRVLLKQGRVRSAHRLADRAKSRTLSDVLTAPPHRRRHASGADHRLLAEMEAVRAEYQRLQQPVQTGPDPVVTLRGSTTALSSRLAELEQRLAALWDEWELRQMERLGGGRVITADPGGRLRSLLPARTALVEYFVAEEQVVAFVSDRRGLRGWVELGPLEPVRRALEMLQLNLDAVASLGAQAPPGLQHNARGLLQELYRHLWKPLLPVLPEHQRAVIIPHRILHLVPFEALHDGRQYLVERLEVTLAPSRTVWAHCRRRESHPGGRDLVMGFSLDGALPFVDEEAALIAGALGVKPLRGPDAVSERLRGPGPYRVIHLAVHGEFRADNPHFSTLLLGDGPLTAADVAGLNLDASLVVLSGCGTGLSRITQGEELQGMISAFFQAGCSSVLASRWRVDDRETTALMTRFYEGLLAGQEKGAALREAQAKMAAADRHPFYWAAFGLVGDSRPLA